jgi:undecaprenyl-diphosphatase
VLASITAFDEAALHATLAMVGAVPYLGQFYGTILDSYLLKTALPIALLWTLWLTPSGRMDERLGAILASLAGLMLAIGLGRLGQVALPHRLRPIVDPRMQPLLPLPELAALYDGWSAFPSDHATLAGALIAATFAVSRPAGVASALWLLLITLLPRLYLGLHWWSDVLAGLVIGAGATAAVLRTGVPDAVTRIGRRLAAERPPAALAGMFLVSFEIATLFDGTRGLARTVSRALID